jgi:spore coat polysaccharide biosynthesis predicted glycosyltransferase SpsG
MTRPAVTVLADAGPDAGLGHVARSSALATALAEREADVRCVALGADASFDFDGISWRVDEPPQAAAFVLDSYRLASAEIEQLAGRAPLVRFVDAAGRAPHAGLVIDVTGDDGDASRLTGLQYACLRRAYWDVEPKPIIDEVRRVLVTTGGTDPGGGAARWAQSIQSAIGAEVTLVVGPFADVPRGLNEVEIVHAPDSLAQLQHQSDLVVTGAGQGLLEALAVGTPAIGSVLAGNQQRQGSLLAERGAVTLCASDPDAITAAVGELAANRETRAAQADAGRREIDGQGARRVAAAILRFAATASSE